MLIGIGCTARGATIDISPSMTPFESLLDFQDPGLISLFMSGDVMIGRGIDQVLPHPSDPIIYESYMRSAIGYVDLAEMVNGPIPKPVDFDYIWGDALPVLKQFNPDVRLINLETSVTNSSEYWQGKGINYRMNPENIGVLQAAGIDACSLANNHVLDWGYKGLEETLNTLGEADIRCAGAGKNSSQTAEPVVIKIEGKGRIVIFAFGSTSSGVPLHWAASADKAGVNLLKDFSDKTVRLITAQVERIEEPGDIVVASIHWGNNWGYKIPAEQKRFAHALIDRAGIDLVHGHSSHHVKGIEVYHGKPIIYGAGDFINDYEGIGGYESYRGDLTLMYFAGVYPESGDLAQMVLVPMQIKNFKLNQVSKADANWLAYVLNREGKKLGTRVGINSDNMLVLSWN